MMSYGVPVGVEIFARYMESTPYEDTSYYSVPENFPLVRGWAVSVANQMPPWLIIGKKSSQQGELMAEDGVYICHELRSGVADFGPYWWPMCRWIWQWFRYIRICSLSLKWILIITTIQHQAFKASNISRSNIFAFDQTSEHIKHIKPPQHTNTSQNGIHHLCKHLLLWRSRQQEQRHQGRRTESHPSCQEPPPQRQRCLWLPLRHTLLHQAISSQGICPILKRFEGMDWLHFENEEEDLRSRGGQAGHGHGHGGAGSNSEKWFWGDHHRHYIASGWS